MFLFFNLTFSIYLYYKLVTELMFFGVAILCLFSRMKNTPNFLCLHVKLYSLLVETTVYDRFVALLFRCLVHVIDDYNRPISVYQQKN